MIVAGIGCRKTVSAAQVDAAVEAALARHLPAGRRLGLIAAAAAKGTEEAILAVAAARGLRLALIPQEALEAADLRTLTRSVRSMAATHVNSVSEAAALAAAGPSARLLAPRLALGPVTCALAEDSSFHERGLP